MLNRTYPCEPESAKAESSPTNIGETLREVSISFEISRPLNGTFSDLRKSLRGFLLWTPSETPSSNTSLKIASSACLSAPAMLCPTVYSTVCDYARNTKQALLLSLLLVLRPSRSGSFIHIRKRGDGRCTR